MRPDLTPCFSGCVSVTGNDILSYFATRQDKLFVLIVSPPLLANDTDAAHAANARAVANWLVNDWLAGYPYNNVAVFDFYNVLTSNGGNTNTNGDVSRSRFQVLRVACCVKREDHASRFPFYISRIPHPQQYRR
jgi:hypothetical protein